MQSMGSQLHRILGRIFQFATGVVIQDLFIGFFDFRRCDIQSFRFVDSDGVGGFAEHFQSAFSGIASSMPAHRFGGRESLHACAAGGFQIGDGMAGSLNGPNLEVVDNI